MKERAILFSAPMVRAILAGTKTQTRRLVKPQPEHKQMHDWRGEVIYDGEHRVWCWKKHLFWDAMADRSGMDTVSTALLPLSPWQVGDRLWVKETWRPRTAVNGVDPDVADMLVTYAAGGPEVFFEWRFVSHDWTMPKAAKSGNVTPLFMPRWASRITLEVTDVRVERVQSISDADIAAEGVTEAAVRELRVHKSAKAWTDTVGAMPRDLWRIVWSTINGAESWGSNPWVWVLSFRRVES